MRTVRFDRDGTPRCAPGDEVAPPGPAEVVVQVLHAGINPTDTYHRRRVREGSDELHRTPGVEVSGRVVAAGDRAGWALGDRVFGVVDEGGLAERVLAPVDLLTRVPAALSDQEAAAVPEAFITAHDAISQAGLSAGQTLLVTGSTGGVGMAAVQIGVATGADVIAMTRSAAGAALVRSMGARPVPAPDAGLEEIDYADSVDVVVELVGARHARHDLRALAPRGRMVFVAAQGDEDIAFSLREFKTKRATMIGSTLRRRGHAAKALAVRSFADEVVPLLQEGTVAPRIAQVFAAADVEEAFDFMATPGKHGKVLLDFS